MGKGDGDRPFLLDHDSLDGRQEPKSGRAPRHTGPLVFDLPLPPQGTDLSAESQGG